MSEPSFEWDATKNLDNIRKHGVSFQQAQYAFFDTKRVIAEDLSHSHEEQRYYCFGSNQEGTGILTVRFTYRTDRIRIIGTYQKMIRQLLDEYVAQQKRADK